jgi:NAD(P)-dependent dehydrogenase (short-subunit alcohol dehydrogenase family)
MSGALIVEQEPLTDGLDGVTGRLTDAFVRMRGALVDGRPVVVLLDDGDLLGQGEPVDAAVANGLLGLVRAFALEGAREGWRVNAVTRRGADQPVDETIRMLLDGPPLTGQLLRIGTEQIGKVSP